MTIHRLTEESISQSDVDSLGLDIVGKGVLTKLTTDTRLLVTTEWKLVVKSVVGVDPDGTCAKCVGDLDGGVEGLGVDGGGETVSGGVTELDDLLLSLELGDGANWAEDLLLDNLHVLGDVGEDGWLDEVTLVTLAVTTDLDVGTSLLAGLDVAGKMLVFAVTYGGIVKLTP